MSNVFRIKARVRLVPTQGGYQKDQTGTVVRVTPTQVVVQRDDKPGECRYRISDGMPIGKLEQQFPCYKVVAE